MYTPKIALFGLLSALATYAIPCVQFDTSFNLYAFGGSQDVKLGASSSWGAVQVTPLTTSGRPPWTGNSTQCLLNQNYNLMFVLGADSSDLSKIYIYSFTSNTWSTQTTSSGPTNLGTRSSSVLDHDTSVIYTLPTGSSSALYQLDMSSITTGASSSALAWEAVENPSFSTNGYSVTAAQAANHVLYFGVPSVAAGSADIFVVHYAYFQPTAQSFPTMNGGATFPDTAGQAVSVPSSSNNVPYQIAFVPNDFSSTYLITHWTDLGNYATTSTSPFSSTSLINSTQILPAPTSKDTLASYAASPNSLVQIDSSGNIYYISSAIGNDYTVTSGASWTKMNYQLTGTGTTASSASASGSSTSAASSGSGSATSTGSGSRTSTGTSTGSTTAASAAASTSAKSSAGRVGRMDLWGMAVGAVMVGLAWVL